MSSLAAVGTDHPDAAAYRQAAEAFRSGDHAAIEGLIAADVVWHVPGDHELAGDVRGRDALLSWIGRLPGLGFWLREVDVFASDDHVCAVSVMGARREGVDVQTRVVSVFRFEDGQQVERWLYPDDHVAWSAIFATRSPEPDTHPSLESPLHGSCLCGGVRFEVIEPFTSANHCHCSRCRKHSGTFGGTQARVPRSGFRLLAGEELIRVFRPEGGRVKAFCSVCGSSLFGREWPEGDEVSIRLGALDGDPGIRPELHTFVGSRAPWGEISDDGLPRFDEAHTDD